MPLPPFQFRPVFQQRVWGGRELETRFHKDLPADEAPYGESWEVVDREEAQSYVTSGPLAGKSLHELWVTHREAVFGADAPAADRFPLLLKILDARDVLSIQVHPPAEIAPRLGGEPKTEMWYIAAAEPGAKLYAGVKPGVSRETFAAALQAGNVADLVASLTVSAGDFIFIPSGRLHAIGAGLVIFEIQQNSDTTYRVFDWNRLGLDGLPRCLHVAESLQCIDFNDVQPPLGRVRGSVLVDCPIFHVDKFPLTSGDFLTWGQVGDFSILAVASGKISVCGETHLAGAHLLIPATAGEVDRLVTAVEDSVLLRVQWPRETVQ